MSNLVDGLSAEKQNPLQVFFNGLKSHPKELMTWFTPPTNASHEIISVRNISK
jgi:hypothetical protein